MGCWSFSRCPLLRAVLCLWPQNALCVALQRRRPLPRARPDVRTLARCETARGRQVVAGGGRRGKAGGRRRVGGSGRWRPPSTLRKAGLLRAAVNAAVNAQAHSERQGGSGLVLVLERCLIVRVTGRTSVRKRRQQRREQEGLRSGCGCGVVETQPQSTRVPSVPGAAR